MGITERKNRERAGMRNVIVDAAFALVEEGGFEAVSIRGLAERIEYSPRTIYLYFSDKEAVLEAVRKKGFDELGTILAAADARGGGPKLRIKRLGQAYIAFSAERRNLFSVMCFRVPRIEAETAAGAESGYLSFSVLRRAVADYFRVENPDYPRVRSVAFALWGMAHGMAVLSLFGQDRDFAGVELYAELERALDSLLPEIDT